MLINTMYQKWTSDRTILGGLFLGRDPAYCSLGRAVAHVTCQKHQDTFPNPQTGFFIRVTSSPSGGVGKFLSTQSSLGLVSLSFQNSAKELE